MAGRAKTPDATAPPVGRQSPDSHISASKATLYLSAAPHLRRGMFRRRPPRPVGRSFAVRALFGADRVVPMPAVDIGEVHRQCAIALLQTVLRDLAVVAALAVSAALEPWGTVVVFGFAIVVIALIGRVPLISWLTFAVPVAAFPLPETRKYPLLPVVMIKLNYRDIPSGEYLREIIDRSPIGHPERGYVRATISAWAGELVTSVYFNAALVGHFLRVRIQPYVIAPVIRDLHIAEKLADANPMAVTCKAVVMTARQFATVGERVNHLRRTEPEEADPVMAGMRSLRERYSQIATDHMDQAADVSDIVRVLEAKIITVTMDFLRDHNIDVAEDERRTLNHVQTYTIFGDGVINTGDNSQVNNAKGDRNNQTNTSNGTKG
jgi:hypothetical protein